MAFRDTVKKNGWRQGALVDPAATDLECIDPGCEPAAGDRLLLLSQSCDLLHGSFDTEPNFEALLIKPLSSKPNKGYVGGKHPRTLHFPITSAGDEAWWSASIHDRYRFNRDLVETHEIHTWVEDHLQLKTIIAWIVARYNRIAFPDAFDKRWKIKRKDLEKLIKKLSYGSDLFLLLEPRYEELPDTENYRVEVALLMKELDYLDATKLSTHKLSLTGINNILKGCDGIIVASKPVIYTPTDMTLADLSDLTRWDYSYLSFRDPESTVLPIIDE